PVVRAELGTERLVRVTRGGELVVNDLVTRPDRLETVACRNISAGLDARRPCQVLERIRIERPIEGNLQLRRAPVPGGHRLGRVAVVIADPPQFAFAARAASPVRLAAVRDADQE